MRQLSGKIDGVTEQIHDLTQRVDGNTLILNLVAGVVHDHEQRITSPEGKPLP